MAKARIKERKEGKEGMENRIRRMWETKEEKTTDFSLRLLLLLSLWDAPEDNRVRDDGMHSWRTREKNDRGGEEKTNKGWQQWESDSVFSCVRVLDSVCMWQYVCVWRFTCLYAYVWPCVYCVFVCVCVWIQYTVYLYVKDLWVCRMSLMSLYVYTICVCVWGCLGNHWSAVWNEQCVFCVCEFTFGFVPCVFCAHVCVSVQ